MNGASDFDFTPRRSGDLLIMHNTRPYSVIYYAYHLNGNYEMEGYSDLLPDGWNWYDIDARAPAGSTDDQIRLMFQSLLADRFKLKVHRVTRQVPEFELLIDKGKAKLLSAQGGPFELRIEGKTFAQPAGTCGTSLWREGAHLVCHAATMEKIVASVSSQLHAPVDRHGTCWNL